MLRVLMFLFLAVLCAACKQPGNDAPPTSGIGEQAVPVHVTPAIAYEHACAHCHETGMNDAPRTGDAEAWAGRSELWEAVLFEHAKKGYFKMPAHGLDGRFSDEEIEAAAQYMLELTHPDRPRD